MNISLDRLCRDIVPNGCDDPVYEHAAGADPADYDPEEFALLTRAQRFGGCQAPGCGCMERLTAEATR